MKKINFRDLIIYEDDDYIVVNKPPFIASLKDRNDKISIQSLAVDHHPDCSLCHRLDKETSGALAIAKNKEAYKNLSLQFEHRKVLKIYHAVVVGVHNYKNLKVNMPILVNSRGTVRIDRNGKEAKTVFNSVKAYSGHTLVACELLTGRTHQIRIHLAKKSSPIVGDLEYGGEFLFLSTIKKKFNLKKYTEEEPLMKRVALHAYTIGFSYSDKQFREIMAPYPKDFKVLINQLEKNS